MQKILKISAIICAVLAFLAITSIDASTLSYQTSFDQSFTINDTLTIVLSDSKVSIDSLLPGQSADSDILDVTVISNNPYGYKLSGTVGSTDYTADALYNTADSTKTFTNIGFGTNKSTLGDFDNDTWGYSYSTDGGTTWLGNNGNTGYTGLPLYNTQNTVTFLDTDDISAAEGDTMKFKIGAKAASNKESGEYNNIINFVATGYSFPAYLVTYNANGGTVSPSSEYTRSSVTLPMPTYEGYIFQGWCDGSVSGSTCSGTTYDAGDSFAPSADVTLYAIWEQVDPMQTFSCSSLTTGQTKKLMDTRDGNIYNVGRLADGKCWMLDNLAFNGKDNQGSGSYITMNNSNTNISGSATWNDTIRTGWTSSTQTTYTASYINDASKNVVSSNAKDIAGQWKVGVYYNYCAATVNTICASDISTKASQDVCPKGWRLPTGDSSGEFQTLYNNSNYNTYDKYRDALHLPLSGNFYNGQPLNQGSRGFWWSSTAYNGTNRYYLYVDTDTSGIYPADRNNRYSGVSVRCVAK